MSQLCKSSCIFEEVTTHTPPPFRGVRKPNRGNPRSTLLYSSHDFYSSKSAQKSLIGRALQYIVWVMVTVVVKTKQLMKKKKSSKTKFHHLHHQVRLKCEEARTTSSGQSNFSRPRWIKSMTNMIRGQNIWIVQIKHLRSYCKLSKARIAQIKH